MLRSVITLRPCIRSTDLRDTAFSLKHGKLDSGKARLVARADQLQSIVPGTGGTFQVGYDEIGASVIVIQVPELNSFERPEFIVRAVLGIAEAELVTRNL